MGSVLSGSSPRGLAIPIGFSSNGYAFSARTPEVIIDAPSHGATVPPGSTLNLMGSAYDAEDGTVSDDGLVWYGPQGETLGIGSWVQIRPGWEPGFYTLRLEATDSEGRTASASITVAYGIYPQYLPIVQH